MDYDFIPQAYKQFDNYGQPVEEEDETTKRGVLDRVLSPLMNTSVTSALYNITDDDPDTTFLGGIGAGLSRQFNPFKDDVTDTHTTADVLDNVFGEADGFGGKVVRGVGGFVGDTLLDPMSYVSGAVSAVGKLAKGTGKVETATKLATEGIHAKTSVTLDDCIEVVKKKYNRVPNADTDLELIINSEAKKLMEDFNKKVMRVTTDEMSNKEGISIGVANLPFASKLKQRDKKDNIFFREIVSENDIRMAGDMTISPYYNRMMNNLRQTKIMQAFSKENQLFSEAIQNEEGIKNALNKFYAQGNIGKKSSIKSDKIVEAGHFLEAFRNLTPEEISSLDEAYRNGQLDAMVTKLETYKKIKTDALKNPDIVQPSVSNIQEDIKSINEQLEIAHKILETIPKYHKETLTPSDFDVAKTNKPYRGVSNITRIDSNLDLSKLSEEWLFNNEVSLKNYDLNIPKDLNPEDLIDSLSEADVLRTLYKLESEGLTYKDNQMLNDLNEVYKRAVRIEMEKGRQMPTSTTLDKSLKELEKLEAKETLTEVEKNRIKNLNFKINNEKARLDFLEHEAHKQQIATAFANADNISVEDKLEYIKETYGDNYDKIIQGFIKKNSDAIAEDFTEATRFVVENSDEPFVVTADGIQVKDGNIKYSDSYATGERPTVTEESLTKVRKILNEELNNATVIRAEWKDSAYNLVESRKLFNEVNFTSNNYLNFVDMLRGGKYKEASDYLIDIACANDFGLMFKRSEEKLNNSPFADAFRTKYANPDLKIISPSILRYDVADVPLSNSSTVLKHSKPVYEKGWKSIKELIEKENTISKYLEKNPNAEVTLPLDNIANNGKTHRENIRKLGGMLNPQFGAGNLKPLPDGSIPSSLTGENDFVFESINDLVKVDDEFDNIYKGMNELRTGKRVQDGNLNASHTSMENASEQVENIADSKKLEYTNSANVINKQEGLTAGSGAVNYDTNLDVIYGEDVANFMRMHKNVLLDSQKENYIKKREEDLAKLIEQSKNHTVDNSVVEANAKKINQIAYELNLLRNAETLDDLADTTYLDSVRNLYDNLDVFSSVFSIKGKYTPEYLKGAETLDDILSAIIKNEGFKIDYDAVSSNYDTKTLKGNKSTKRTATHYPTIHDDITTTYSTSALDPSKYKDRSFNVGRLVGDRKKTVSYEELLLSRDARNRYNLEPKDLNEIELLNGKPIRYKRNLENTIVDKNFVVNVIQKEVVPNIRKNLNDKGFRSPKANEYSIVEELSIDDMNYLINSARLKSKNNMHKFVSDLSNDELLAYKEKLQITDGLSEVEVNHNLSELDAINEYLFSKALFGDYTLSVVGKDADIAKYCINKLNDTINSLNENLEGKLKLSNNSSSIAEDDYFNVLSDVLFYDTINIPREKWNNMISIIDKYGDDETITMFSGIEKKKADVIKELEAVGRLNTYDYIEYMHNIIPRTITKEAQDYLYTKGMTKKNPTYGISKEMSIAEANEIMKKRTGIDKWYEDDIASAFTGFVVNTGKDIHQSSTMNQMLHAFGRKYTNDKYDVLADDETIVVKAGALKSYLKKNQESKTFSKVINADLEVLKDYGFNPEEVKYNSMFVTMDKDTYIKLRDDFKTDNSVLNAHIMKAKDADMFNTTAHFQNVESESAFWSMYDKFLTIYKSVNTLPNPGFHINNAIGNAFNSFLYCGSAALNPHKINIARTIIKNPDPKQFIRVNGVDISYKDMNRIFKEVGVTGGYFEGEMAKEIHEHWRMLPGIKQGLRLGTEIEETQRGALFIEAMMNGNSPSEALDVVNQFLFDYSNLTEQEQKYMKRAIPFYTFMRKNVPLQLREMMLQPELYRNLEKGINNFERFSGEDYVRDEDRSEWRKDYIQVPFQIEGKNFGFTPNLPYQQLDRLTPSKLIGQTSPLIKAPIELATGEYAYTGMPISDAGEYLINQFSIPRAVAVTKEKEGIDKTLYPLGQITGMPAGTITDINNF